MNSSRACCVKHAQVISSNARACILFTCKTGRYIYLPLSDCQALAAAGQWNGCINLTTLAAAEQRAFGWYWWFKNASTPNITDYLNMNYTGAMRIC